MSGISDQVSHKMVEARRKLEVEFQLTLTHVGDNLERQINNNYVNYEPDLKDSNIHITV